ncbi:hypothetical protein Glove_123g204 [Diversispora epigaea]|uniref:G-patch domain-containing protein n=1 Tax=Diversispora epigaea TaxID=1348612 RepID=A0A397IYU8_9GLOM|nr:hypothetical protein Glove_123g204 [Diversispora epigaea]
MSKDTRDTSVNRGGFSMTLQKKSSKNNKTTKNSEKRIFDNFEPEKFKKRRITDATYDNEDNYDDLDQSSKIELVTGFEDNKIQSLYNNKKGVNEQLIIPALKNVDWVERNKSLYYLPPPQNNNNGDDDDDDHAVKTSTTKTTETLNNNKESTSYGLVINKKKTEGEKEEEEEEKKRSKSSKSSVLSSSSPSSSPSSSSLSSELKSKIQINDSIIEGDEQSLKQQAIKELLKGSDTENIKVDIEESNLVLSVEENKNFETKKERLSDQEAFRREVERLPDETDIDYDSVPIEEFGLAMLRGMGWKPGMAIGKNQNSKAKELYEPKPRPTHLGLGASPLPLPLPLPKNPDGSRSHSRKREKHKNK